MDAILSAVLNLSVVVFAVASMLTVGLGHTLRELVGPLRDVLNVFRVLVANFVLVPLLGFALIRMLDLQLAHAIGIFLVSVAAGAPFLIKLTLHAEHDVRLSATLLVLLLPATVLFMPIVVPAVLPEADVSPGAIARPLVLTMMLPLAIGLLFRSVSKEWAVRLQPILGTLSSIALAALVLSTVVLNLRGIVGIGSAELLAAALLIVGAFFAGYGMSGLDMEGRGVLGLATAQRNIAAATVVAARSLGDRLPGALVMVVVTSLVTLAVLFPTGTLLRHRLAAREREKAATAAGAVTARR